MNKKLSVLALALLSGSVFAGTAEVTWGDMSKFRDVRPSNETRKGFQERVKTQLNKHFDKLASKLPEGYKLTVKVNDLDLAGDVLPGGIHEVRVVKSLYFPTMKFDVTVQDDKGQTLLAGEQKLKDMSFMDKARLNIIDGSFDYEKQMLDDWFKKSVLPSTTGLASANASAKAD